MDLSQLENKLNINFKNKDLLKQALTHRSYLNEHPNYEGGSNERLEFLGDTVLNFLTSSHLYKNYPHAPEGDLTNFRSYLVSTKSLGKAAKKLGLGKYLRLARGEDEGGGRKNISLLADTFEAVLGAIYLDRGLLVALKFVKKNLLLHLSEAIKSKAYKDPKSCLQEIVQKKFKLSPIYKVLEEKGPDHAKIFIVGAWIKQEMVASGEGKNKQEAEEAAAQAALEKIG
jgi:ribonuclease-3